jgi:hypothetical protein
MPDGEDSVWVGSSSEDGVWLTLAVKGHCYQMDIARAEAFIAKLQDGVTKAKVRVEEMAIETWKKGA